MRNSKYFLYLFTFVALLSITSCSTSDDVNPDGQKGAITLYSVTSGENITKVTDYKVSGSDLNYQKDVAKHQEIWTLAKKIITVEYRDKIKQYLIINGEVESLDASVSKITDDLKQWQLAVAINYAYEGGFNNKGSLEYNITHEFGHIVCLNDSQVDGLVTEANCKNYFAEDGCAKTGSYINTYYNTFWPKSLVSEFNNNANNTGFYNKHKDMFVTEYAASSPLEDFAEVFAYYVTKDLPASSSTAIKDLKVLSFQNIPEMVSLRKTIRTNLGLK